MGGGGGGEVTSFPFLLYLHSPPPLKWLEVKEDQGYRQESKNDIIRNDSGKDDADDEECKNEETNLLKLHTPKLVSLQTCVCHKWKIHFQIFFS